MKLKPVSAEPRSDGAGKQSAPGPVPRHVAIIMDGNGRWAKARGLPRAAGHRAGADAVRKVLRAAGKAGVECLTLYAFSSENWRRPAAEINDLMGLLRFYIDKELDALHREGIRLKVLGDLGAFDAETTHRIEQALARTASNDRMTLAVALNYGARGELVRVVRDLAVRVADNRLRPSEIDEPLVDSFLDTAALPPLDLLIRTSGECRLSNFLLWQAAYSELLFVDTLWPDFGEEELDSALTEFARRERRYGGL